MKAEKDMDKLYQRLFKVERDIAKLTIIFYQIWHYGIDKLYQKYCLKLKGT